MNRYGLAAAALLVGAVTTATGQSNYTVLHNFGMTRTETQAPYESGIIAQGRDGNLFSAGGTFYLGAAFRISPAGSFVPMHTFSRSDGQLPSGGLTLGSNGWLYGTTVYGGQTIWGTIFKMRYSGEVTTLHSFDDSTNGGSPWAPPIQSLSGDFYGTTRGTTTYNYGSLYRISNTGVFTLLHAMSWSDGAHAFGPLVQATNYWFYGTALEGGANYLGTLFRVSSKGDFEVLFNFDGAHGANPMAGLIQGTNGSFYGVTMGGGAYGLGALFEMTPNHTVKVLHSFLGGSVDGSTPEGGIVQASDGNLYGTTSDGGEHQGGVLFRLTPGGAYTVLHHFDGPTGVAPRTGLMQHTNGRLYGMTSGGGYNGDGVFFSFDLGLPPFVTYLPVYGRAGALVEILGQGFTPDSLVYFNGVRADATTVYPTFIKAFVPAGAATGYITVTTGDLTLRSDKVFIVRP